MKNPSQTRIFINQVRPAWPGQNVTRLNRITRLGFNPDVYISLTHQLNRYTYALISVHLSHYNIPKIPQTVWGIKVKLLHSMYSQHQLNINCGMYFKVQIYLDGLLMLVTSHKNLVVDNLRTMRRHFGWVFNIPYSIIYKEYQSIIYYNTNVAITIFLHMWPDLPKRVLYMHSLKTNLFIAIC